MKKNKRKAILCVLFLYALLPVTVSAAVKLEEAVLLLPVRQVFETGTATGADLHLNGTYEISSAAAPMPEGSEGARYRFSMAGREEWQELTFRYGASGTYRYQLRQIIADEEGYVYDRTVYTITVHVKPTGAGKLVTEVIAENGSGKKCGEILFRNTYEEKKELSAVPKEPAPAKQSSNPPKTGDETKAAGWLLLEIGSLCFVICLWGRQRLRNREKECKGCKK